MFICKDDKSYLKNNLISFLTSVKEELLYTVCHEIPCTCIKNILEYVQIARSWPTSMNRDIEGHSNM